MIRIIANHFTAAYFGPASKPGGTVMETVMTFESDRAFLERRAQQERELAEKAADPCAYRTHTELARQYERRLVKLLAQAENGRPAPASPGAGEALH